MESAVFAALALWSVLPFAVLFLSFNHGRVSLARGQGVFNGSAGLGVGDHMQYLGWIRDAGEHVLISNRYDVGHDPHLFLHPVFALSGLIWKLGASLQLAYLAWKPLVLILLFVGFAAYVRRLVVGDRAAQAAALILALFFFTPAAPLVQWLDLGGDKLEFGTNLVGLETFSAGYTWGGASPATISVALMPLFLLGIERILDPAKRRPGRSARFYVAWTALAGLFSAWLHPWQGMTLLVAVAGLVAWDRFNRRNVALAAPLAATAAPLLYMFALSHTQTSWAHAARPGHGSHFGTWLIVSLAPAFMALPGLPGSRLDVQERLVRLWPAAALLVYFGLQQTWFYHAFVGLSLPLAILGVRGWRRLRLSPIAGVAVILALTLPGMAYAVQELRKRKADHFLAYGEKAAFDYLDRSQRPGPVLAPLWLGQAVPAFTDRNTWLGHYYWTPNYGSRLGRDEALFSGRLSAVQARELVRETGAAFVVSDCRHHADLRRSLGPLVSAVRRFGCATVYAVDQPGRSGRH